MSAEMGEIATDSRPRRVTLDEIVTRRSHRRSSVTRRSSWWDPSWWEETRGRLLSPSLPRELDESMAIDAVMPIEWPSPPRDAKPVLRWWWPGGSVEPIVIDEQLKLISRAGFGAVEIQPFLLALGSQEEEKDQKLRTVGNSSFFELMAYAAASATKLGLAFDVTLGSGWPGGLPTGKENAEQQLLMSSVDLQGPCFSTAELPPPPQDSIHRAHAQMMMAQLDTVGPPDTTVQLVAVVACQLISEAYPGGASKIGEAVDLTSSSKGGKLDWKVPQGKWRI